MPPDGEKTITTAGNDVTWRFECNTCALRLWYDYEDAWPRLAESYKTALAKVQEEHTKRAPDCKGEMYYQGWDWRHAR